MRAFAGILTALVEKGGGWMMLRIGSVTVLSHRCTITAYGQRSRAGGHSIAYYRVVLQVRFCNFVNLAVMAPFEALFLMRLVIEIEIKYMESFLRACMAKDGYIVA